MSAYVIAHYDITDPDGYGAYAAAAGPSVFAFGGEVLAADQNAIAVEGEKPDNVLILKFPSVEHAQQWYESDAYQAALPHRTDNTKNGTLIIASAFAPPS